MNTKQPFEEQDKDTLARIGFFYLQWAAGKSSHATYLDVAAPLAKKYFGVSATELFFGGKIPPKEG
jgi:hypothetical protein